MLWLFDGLRIFAEFAQYILFATLRPTRFFMQPSELAQDGWRDAQLRFLVQWLTIPFWDLLLPPSGLQSHHDKFFALDFIPFLNFGVFPGLKSFHIWDLRKESFLLEENLFWGIGFFQVMPNWKFIEFAKEQKIFLKFSCAVFNFSSSFRYF